jgi:hypothetical protein
MGGAGSRFEPQRHGGTEEDRAGLLMGADGPLMGDPGSRYEPQRHRGTEAQRKTEPVVELGKDPALWLLARWLF